MKKAIQILNKVHKHRPKQPKASDKSLAKTYDSLNRWIDYWYHVNILEKTHGVSFLEIGKGTGVTEFAMKKRGYEYVTVDNNPDLSPDVVADITSLPFPDNSFDVVCAFEVLEHLHYSEVPQALSELRRVSRKHVVISLPYACLYLSIAFQFFYFKKIEFIFDFLNLQKNQPTYFNIAFPLFFLKRQGMHSSHGWELGRKGYSKKKFAETLKSVNLEILKVDSRIFYPYHIFYSLRKF